MTRRPVSAVAAVWLCCALGAAFAQDAGAPSQDTDAAVPSQSPTVDVQEPADDADEADGDGRAVRADAPAEPRLLSVGILDDAPPFSDVTRFGVRSGFDVDVAYALCGRLDAECTLLPMAKEDLVPALMARRIQMAVASLTPTQRLAPLADFTIPYLEVPLRFVARARRAGDLEASDDTVYGAVADSAAAEYLAATYPNAGSVRLYANEEELWIDLALERLDAVLAPALAARRDFLSAPIGAAFGFVDEAETLRGDAVVAVREGDRALLSELNAALSDLVTSEDYAALVSRTFEEGLGFVPSPSR